MDMFIGLKFGIPISYSSKYHKEPYTGSGFRLVFENEEFFVAVADSGNTYTRLKKDYTYKITTV